MTEPENTHETPLEQEPPDRLTIMLLPMRNQLQDLLFILLPSQKHETILRSLRPNGRHPSSVDTVFYPVRGTRNAALGYTQ